jgi:hypothetical protein
MTEMAYELMFETNMLPAQTFKDWERQFNYDLARKLHGKTWRYETLAGLHKRWKMITGREACKETIILNSPRYGRREVVLKLPGMSLGYVSFDLVVGAAKHHGICRIPFKSFYDSRQRNAKDFSEAAVVVRHVK